MSAMERTSQSVRPAEHCRSPAPDVIDVRFIPSGLFGETPFHRWAAGAVALLAVAILFGLPISYLIGRAFGWNQGPEIILAGGFLFGLAMMLFIRRCRASRDPAYKGEVREAVRRGEPWRIVRQAAQKHSLLRSPQPLDIAVQEFPKCGLAGTTLRLWHERSLPELPPPSRIRFEPHSLDESDPQFSELEATTFTSTSDEVASSPAPLRQGSSPGFTKRLIRNHRLRGGWPLLAILVIGFLPGVVGAVLRRQVTVEVFVYGLLLVSVYLVPAAGLFGTRQWLLVPGGLVVRKARLWDQRFLVRLFDRRRSVLCILHQRDGRWAVQVADAEHREQTLATDREVALLLRTWRSPLEPPPPDRLADLV